MSAVRADDRCDGVTARLIGAFGATEVVWGKETGCFEHLL